MKRKVELKNVKGSYDYSPSEQSIRYFIQDTLRKVFVEYGYKPLETPILCYYDLLAGKYDENNDLLNEIYKLSDQGDRKLGLRYDLTVPFAKYISMTKDIRLPFKRYEIGKVFRDGPVKVGRDREFLQCDVDVVGLDGNLIEAELISLWFKGYSALGIGVYVKYNSRNLMRGLIQEIGAFVSDETIDKVVTIIDKMDKISEKELIDELGNIGLSSESAEKLLSYFKMSLADLKIEFADCENEMLKKGLDEVASLKNILGEIGLGELAVFSPSLARGQDYYTGNVFEVYAKNGELSCSLGGGGRYDKMITNFIDDGNVYPAVGVSFGLSTIYEILKMRGDGAKSLIDIYVVPMNTEIEALKIANKIRELGFSVELEMTGKKIKKCFEYANRESIPYVIVLGENEINEGKFNVKNMETGNEVSVNLVDIEKLVEIIQK